MVPDIDEHLNAEEAAAALRVFDRLKLPDVFGEPTMATAGGDWFRDIVRCMFGAYDPETNERAIKELFLLVPKKNGKTSYAGALMVVAMIRNRRPYAEALLIAPTKTIANLAYKQAAGIIEADPELSKLFWCRDSRKIIIHRRTRAELAIKAADTDVITGSKSTYILIDETHEFAKKHNAEDLFVEIRGALAARPDGFMVQITTQSKEPPAGVFKSELQIARKVRNGELTLPTLAVLYEFPKDVTTANRWRNENLWHMVNPNLGRSVDIQYLRNELIKADEIGIERLALIASQHFNIEIGLSLSGDRWSGADYWEAAALESLTLDEFIDMVDVAVVGIDGGGLDDLMGLCLAGRHKKTGHAILWHRAWCKKRVLKLRKDISPNLRDFEKEGTLRFCTKKRPRRDYEEISEIVLKLHEAELLPKKNAIGLDPLGVSDLRKALIQAGIKKEQMVAIAQGVKLSSAVWGMERQLEEGTLWHDGSTMMNWVVGNAKAEQRGNAIYISKQAAGKAKIDPLIAGFNGYMLLAMNPIAERSVYENRGIRRV